MRLLILLQPAASMVDLVAGFLLYPHLARGVADFLLVPLRNTKHDDDADPAEEKAEPVTSPRLPLWSPIFPATIMAATQKMTTMRVSGGES